MFVAAVGLLTLIVALAGLLSVLDLLKVGLTTVEGAGGSGSGNGTGTGGRLALLQDISAEGGLPPHLPLFEVSGASHTSYLRTTATATYADGLWKTDRNSQRYQYSGDKLVPPVRGYKNQTVDEIEVNQLDTLPTGILAVPTSLYPLLVSSSTPFFFLPREQTFLSEKGLPQTYSFQTAHYDFEQSGLLSAELQPEPDYLQLPYTITERTRQLALEITSKSQSPYEKAKAIESYLKANCVYDFDYKRAPSGKEANDWFLFEEKRGVCANFNSAFVVLCRAAGIPARLVGGFLITSQPGKQVVYADQAHAWSEVEFRELGWITFDATGAGPGLLPTQTEITSIPADIQKGHTFSIQGTVRTKTVTVEDVMVQVFLNPKKAKEGGLLIGKGIVSNGTFSIDVLVPKDTKLGDYQVLAQSMDSIRFQESWSDPKVRVLVNTNTNVDVPPRVKLREPVVITGILTEEFGPAVVGQHVDIYLNDQLMTQLATDGEGRFKWEQTFSRAGDYTIKADFPGADYWSPSSKSVRFQVLVPTTLSLKALTKATTGESLSLEGSLSETTTVVPVPNERIQIIAGGQPLSDNVTTDGNGMFSIKHSFDKAGHYQVQARFSSVPFYFESEASTELDVMQSTSRFPWLYLIIGLCLAVGGVGGFFIYRWQRARLVAARPGAEIVAEPAVAPMLNIEGRSQEALLSITFPQIEPPLPDIWGLEDEMDIVCHLVDSNGKALPGKSLELAIGKDKVRLSTDTSGTVKLRRTFTEKGQFHLKARFNLEHAGEGVLAERILRIVDYREEIVDLFKSLTDQSSQLDIVLAPKATPREIEQAVLRARKDIPEGAVDKVVTCFEEADYSLHSIKRGNYTAMYLAQKEIVEHGGKPEDKS